MPKLRLPWIALLSAVVGACSASTDDLVIELAPDVVSSLDGTVTVRATAFADRGPAANQPIELTVAYTDRNGTAHAIAPVDGKTDKDGVFESTIAGLDFDGTGTITATLQPAGKLTATATFAVLDRTPPVVAITPPTGNTVAANSDVQIKVHITDEIGVSQVVFESTPFNTQGGNNGNRQRSTVVASGATDTMVTFDLGVPQNATVGQTVTFYALATDLSGNQAAATPVMVTVTP